MDRKVDDMPLVSVVILTRDREEMMRRCVKSILDNTYKNIEIVVFDNSSNVARAAIRNFLSSLNSKCRVKYIESSPKGFAEMRQTAIDNSEGEIVMSIDDDCIADKNAISRIVKRFVSDKKTGIVGGEITNIGFDSELEFKGRGRIGVNGQYEQIEDAREAEVFGSANMSIERQAFERVGGYDLFFSGGLEEADLTFSIKRAGYNVVYEPLVKITHYYCPGVSVRKWGDISGPNAVMLRLYFFFKHFMPSNSEEWLKFLRTEIRMFLKDVRLLVPKRRKTETGKVNIEEQPTIEGRKRVIYHYPKVAYCVFIEFVKIMIARISIPYLICRAYRANARQRNHWSGRGEVA